MTTSLQLCSADYIGTDAVHEDPFFRGSLTNIGTKMVLTMGSTLKRHEITTRNMNYLTPPIT